MLHVRRILSSVQNVLILSLWTQSTAHALGIQKPSVLSKRTRLCIVSLHWPRNKEKIEWLYSRSLTRFKLDYTAFDLSSGEQFTLYMVCKRTILRRLFKVWWCIVYMYSAFVQGLKLGNFTKNVWLIKDFATQLFRGFMNIDIFFKIACTEPKV